MTYLAGRKDPILAAVLGFLFGCFGLIYVSVKHAAIAFVAIFSIGLCTGGVGFLGWFLCGVYGYVLAESHNQQLKLLSVNHYDDPFDAPGPSPSAWAPAPSSPRADDPYAALYCTECGIPMKRGAKFCGGCGAPTT